MKVLLITIAILPLSAHAEDFAKFSNDQLCVAYAETVITGDSYRVNLIKRIPADAIIAELGARQVTCEPAQGYMQAAQYRLQARAERRAAAVQALQNYSNQPYAAPPASVPNMPQTTNCRLVGQNLNCTTW